MFPELPPTQNPPPEWRTAAILGRTQARPFVARLAAAGIDHVTSAEGQCIRVSVQVCDLELAMQLRLDTPVVNKVGRKVQPHYHTFLRMLVSIPLGAFLGNVISYSMASESRLIPAFTCVSMVVFLEIIAIALRERGLHSRTKLADK